MRAAGTRHASARDLNYLMTSPGVEENENDQAGAEALRILVVDDEDFIRVILTEILTEEGYAVTTAFDGEQAVELLGRQTFDLVITDLQMPGLDGAEVLRAANRIDPTYPVIMITGYPSMETVARSVREGAADYITKPFNVQVVRDTVARFMVRRRARGEPSTGVDV